MQRLRRITLLLFYFSQVLYLSSEPQSFSIQVQACRSDYWRYWSRSGISTLFVPSKKVQPHQVRFFTNIIQTRGDVAFCQGVPYCWISTKQIGFVFSFLKEYGHNLETQNQHHSIYLWQIFYIFSLILLFKWQNKEIGCSCYQICEKHSVSRISKQLKGLNFLS